MFATLASDAIIASTHCSSNWDMIGSSFEGGRIARVAWAGAWGLGWVRGMREHHANPSGQKKHARTASADVVSHDTTLPLAQSRIAGESKQRAGTMRVTGMGQYTVLRKPLVAV
jgi:hypothetical protein